jgi:2'-5' RNA ligase
VLDDVTSDIAPFTLRVGDLGVFNKKHTSIVWVGVTKGKEKLRRIFRRLEDEIVTSGFTPENRKYRPHITIGKKVVFSQGRFSNGLPYFDQDINITAITLFQSHRIDGVLTYTPLYRKILSGA